MTEQAPLAQYRDKLVGNDLQTIHQHVRLQVEAVDRAGAEPVLDMVGELLTGRWYVALLFLALALATAHAVRLIA